MECKVIVREDKDIGQWIVRGLDYDICTQGDSIKSALYNFCELIVLEQALSEHLGEKLEDRIPRAPQYWWDIYEEKYKNIRATELPDMPLNENKPIGTLTPHLVTA